MRRILLTWSPFGIGHRGVARAVGRSLSRRQGAVVRELALEDAFGGTTLFAWATGASPGRRLDSPTWQAARPGPEELVAAFDPVAGRILRAEGAAARLVAVACDLDPPSEWFEGPLRAILVADEEAAAAARVRGVAQEGIFVVGLPVCEAFGEPVEQGPRARERLGLEPGTPVLLLAAAGMRPSELEEVARSLRAACRQAPVLVDVGMDPEAFQIASRLEGMVVLGKREDVAAWWASAELVVGRARPDVVSRALAVGRPLVVLPPLGPTEERTARAVTARGLGWMHKSLPGLGAFVAAALRTGAQVAAAARSWRGMRAAERIAGVLDQLACF